MFGKLRKLAGKTAQFLMPDFYETDRTLENPCRGWYRMYTWNIDTEPDREQLSWCSAFSLIFIFVDISGYREKELSDEALSNLKSLMEIMRRLHRDIILRFAYDTEGNGLKNEPSDFGLVLSHIDSVSRLLSVYDKNIFVFQGLFVGSWGEMHLSKFVDADRQAQLTNALRRYLPYTFLATRRPYYYRSLYRRVDADHRTGLFDDGIFGSKDDLGTFGSESKNRMGWGRPWSKPEEIEFIAQLAEYAPIGGEILVLGCLGGAYLVGKRRKEERQ